MLIRNNKVLALVTAIVLLFGVISLNIGSVREQRNVPVSEESFSQSSSPKHSLPSVEARNLNSGSTPSNAATGPQSNPIDPVAQAEQEKSVTEMKDANNLTFTCEVMVETIDAKNGLYNIRVAAPIEIQEVWIRVQANYYENAFSLNLNNGAANRPLDLPVSISLNYPKVAVYSRSELVKETSMCNNFN